MLSQIVRPMVQTQIRLLANSRATRSTLVSTVAQWLGFLGVRAEVTRLDTAGSKIQLCLTVDRPDACDRGDWQQILTNLNTSSHPVDLDPHGHALAPDISQFTHHQQRKMQRLLAYLIQVGNPDTPIDWEQLHPQLQPLGLDESTLLGIRAALKVPQCLEDLLADLDADVAAIALPKAVSIAMLDRQVNPSEDLALMALLQALKGDK
ncbi:hypothetical protein [Pantanalinema sp. GBBB05]|uniref:hypothetical protein n=1 Tax=Pantanalinema sp. GBBB05 TaxID=2604139 RepID=UPI001DE7E5E0|nr:hypothetical protein [Pantanalinema sp. GBBB05]